MRAVRAKFRCSSVQSGEGTTSTTYKFVAAYDADQPEDQRYATYTPSGELRMVVDNPAVTFKLGQYYYLDFTPAEG